MMHRSSTVIDFRFLIGLAFPYDDIVRNTSYDSNTKIYKRYKRGK